MLGRALTPCALSAGDASLLGRSAIGLLAPAIFGHRNRRRFAAGLAATGFFHARVPLSSMRHDEIYAVLGHASYGTPITSGNLESSVLMTETETVTSDVDTLAAPPSHHTAKLDCWSGGRLDAGRHRLRVSIYRMAFGGGGRSIACPCMPTVQGSVG